MLCWGTWAWWNELPETCAAGDGGACCGCDEPMRSAWRCLVSFDTGGAGTGSAAAAFAPDDLRAPSSSCSSRPDTGADPLSCGDACWKESKGGGERGRLVESRGRAPPASSKLRQETCFAWGGSCACHGVRFPAQHARRFFASTLLFGVAWGVARACY